MESHRIYSGVWIVVFVIPCVLSAAIDHTTATPEPSSTTTDSLQAALERESQAIADPADRTKRQYSVPPQHYDYYNQYYNNYYANYYAAQYNQYSAYNQKPFAVAPSPPPIRPASADRFDNNNIPTPSVGTHYVYTPIFQYKETHHKHDKLFVPNIFG